MRPIIKRYKRERDFKNFPILKGNPRIPRSVDV